MLIAYSQGFLLLFNCWQKLPLPTKAKKTWHFLSQPALQLRSGMWSIPAQRDWIGTQLRDSQERFYFHDNKRVMQRTPCLSISAIECSSVRSDVWSCSSHLATMRGKPRESEREWSKSLPSRSCWTVLGVFSFTLLICEIHNNPVTYVPFWEIFC